MNRLADETSPYLLQHAANPVDWYPWGEEALSRARVEGRPILLSIGYAACHWCHVMERESFEDAATARVMNERFVCVKVDREERPDLDSVYMDSVVALTGSGGWPMTVFLTPEREPFFGGTYFPPEPRQDALAGAHDLLALVVPRLADRLHHLAPRGQPVARLGREVGAGVERHAVWRHERVQRPAAGAGHRLHRVHVDRVDVRALLAVDLDADQPLVHRRGDVLMLERLALHHVAPVARGVADRDEHGLVLGAGALERLVAPRVPVDGVLRVLEQVRRGL